MGVLKHVVDVVVEFELGECTRTDSAISTARKITKHTEIAIGPRVPSGLNG